MPPCSVRIGSSEYEQTEGLHHIAFLTPNGEMVLVAMNESEADITVTLKEKTEVKGLVCELPAHSIVTLKGTL